MPSVKNTKLTIGGPEGTPGAAEPRTHVIPIRGLPGIDAKIETADDPAIVGRNMSAGSFLASKDASGNIPLTPRPCGGLGKLIRSALGIASTPYEVGGCIRIRYTGSEASCRITASGGTNLNSSVGVGGSETGDMNFGTGGDIDLADTGSDTMAELIALIDGYTDYEAKKVFGADDLDVGNVHAAVRQGKDRWAYIFFESAGSGIYAHDYSIDLTDTERPTYSIQKDGFQDNFLYAGCCVNNLNFSAALKAMLEADADVLAMSEENGQSVSALNLEDRDPLLFYKGATSIGQNEYTFIRNVSLAFGNNLNPDGYGQGSYSRLYHQKGETVFTGSIQLRLDAESLGERAKIENGDVIGASFFFKGKDYTVDIPELLLFDMPYLQITMFDFPENNGVIDAKIDYKGIYPKGTVYGNPLMVTMLTPDAGAY